MWLTKDQIKDTGLVLVLVFLVLGIYYQNYWYFKVSTFLLLIDMIFPKFYYPLAVIWISFSNILGEISSTIILTLIFILFIVPLGLIRKICKKDELKLKLFKENNCSVLQDRNHLFQASNLTKSF